MYVSGRDTSAYDSFIYIFLHEPTETDRKVILDKCNMLLEFDRNKNLQEFYNKYKDRIVKDNVLEDKSYYYKILEE